MTTILLNDYSYGSLAVLAVMVKDSKATIAYTVPDEVITSKNFLGQVQHKTISHPLRKEEVSVLEITTGRLNTYIYDGTGTIKNKAYGVTEINFADYQRLLTESPSLVDLRPLMQERKSRLIRLDY